MSRNQPENWLQPGANWSDHRVGWFDCNYYSGLTGAHYLISIVPPKNKNIVIVVVWSDRPDL